MASHFPWPLLLILLALALLPESCHSCTTLAAAPGATWDGSVLLSHSNDGAGDVAGNLLRVPAAEWPDGARRLVSGGYVPQVSHTFAYWTKVGGYAAMNEFQVGLAESTCSAVFPPGNASILNIVDLGEIALERSSSARNAISIMGSLAEKYGYSDNGEHLFVGDPKEVWIFHILPDDTGGSAIWVAQRIPAGHVSVVANEFVIREVNVSDAGNFLASGNILQVAKRHGFWNGSGLLDFTQAFSRPEGRKYASGRRMWQAFEILSDHPVSPYYDDLIQDRPYPVSAPAVPSLLHASNFTSTMRSYYAGTPFDLTQGLAAGPFGSPDRWAAGDGEKEVGGAWERSIATYRSVVSYVLQLRNWLDNSVGGVMWFAFHAAHTSFYVPFPAGMPAKFVPVSYTDNAMGRLGRGESAWQAARAVFNIAQLKFSFAIQDIVAAQTALEAAGARIQADVDSRYRDERDLEWACEEFAAHAAAAVRLWWQLSDDLLLKYADGYCNAPACVQRSPGYPAWWLRAVNYSAKPRFHHKQ